MNASKCVGGWPVWSGRLHVLAGAPRKIRGRRDQSQYKSQQPAENNMIKWSLFWPGVVSERLPRRASPCLRFYVLAFRLNVLGVRF